MTDDEHFAKAAKSFEALPEAGDGRETALRSFWATLDFGSPWIDDALDRTNYLLNELERRVEQPKRGEAFLGLGETWPTTDVLRKLADALDWLVPKYKAETGEEYDERWETIGEAVEVARDRLAAWDTATAPAYAPEGFASPEAEVLHLRRRVDAYERGIAEAVRVLNTPGKTDPRLTPELIEARRRHNADPETRHGGQPVATTPEECEQPASPVDEARKAAARLNRARETLRAKVSAHPTLGQVYLRSLVVDFLRDLEAPERSSVVDAVVDAEVSVPGPRRVAVRVRTTVGTADLLQRVLLGVLPVDYSVTVSPKEGDA